MDAQEFEEQVCSETAADEPDASGVRPSSSPSFLVRNMGNVNDQLFWARGLKTMWDFLEYKVRTGRMHVLLNRKDDCRAVKLMPVIRLKSLQK